MMQLLVLMVPAMACVLMAVAASGVQRRLAPMQGAVLLATAALAAAVAVWLSLAAVAIAYIVEIPHVAGAVGWCRSMVSTSDHVPGSIGLLAVAALGTSLRRSVRFLRRSTWRCDRHQAAVVVVDSHKVEAVALPGRPNQILVSTALLDVLDDSECHAMLAHEQAHIRLYHHRFLVLAGLAAAAVPLLAPIATRVRYCTERWADEAAATAVGDRLVVARAISKAALAGSDLNMPLALTGLGVAGRVSALLHPGRTSQQFATPMFGLAVTALVFSISASTLQVHHLVGFLRHVCG